MSRMVDGEWRTDVEQLITEDGAFEREETTFRDWIRDDPQARYRPEPGRYHLYISRACPWAHRVTLVRRLKGLEDVISMDVVDPVREDQGWEFAPEKDGCTEDSIGGVDYLREVYAAADSQYSGRVTVPVLWDRKEATIVNNESGELMRMIDTVFDEYAERDVRLYPPGKQDAIDRIVSEIYEPINDGVYRAGFAETQEAYESAVTDLFEALEHWDAVLSEQRFLLGDTITLADVALFTTLYRFDPVYYVHFKCNERRIDDFPNLSGYLRDLYQLPGVEATCNIDHVKRHYYMSHTDINPKRIVPTGPDRDLTADHDRDSLSSEPPLGIGG
ncbi:MAG: glutathione S-transferase family protein [Halodesulfurarchaeum sp.]